ncbi:MAG: hypothetical protein ACRD6X_19345 [Pyrinomonadaceae bacterium]
MQAADGLTLPGWRDFERATALCFKGEAQESKAIFDVLLEDRTGKNKFYGLSCKMRSELNRINRDGRVTIELSNSAGQFWAGLRNKGLDQTNYKNSPNEVGASVISTVNEWHRSVSMERGGVIDVYKSFYFVLSWNRKGDYQLHQFSLALPNSNDLDWSFPLLRHGTNPEELGKRLIGNDGIGNLFEWYGESGGQSSCQKLWK